MSEDCFIENAFFDEDALYQWEFKNKYYPHFDSPSCQDRVKKILGAIEKDVPISHTFYPLIRFVFPKYKRDENGHLHVDRKNPRYIMHTARIDANLYSFYRNLLMNNYEKILKELKIEDCVIAYRKIPLDDNIEKGKCNVHFANEAIEAIKRKTEEVSRCSAIAMDIGGFFDNLDHKIIKRQWCRIMGFANGLPRDHFTIFKNITRFRYVKADELEKKLHFKFKTLKRKQICTPGVFREKVMPLLSKENKLGIPQGTTISDVIANMYMLDFDILMKKFANKYKSYYRRYSDDILFICPIVYQEKAIKFITWLAKRSAKLLISDKKTLVSQFEKTEVGIQCASYRNKNGQLAVIKKPFEYLGLSFDGNYKDIRKSTISMLYAKLSKRIKKEVDIAYRKLHKKGIIFPSKDDLYKIISFDMIYDSYMKPKHQAKDFCGNFYTYVKLIIKVTGNEDLLRIFKRLRRWIRKRAIIYCEDLIKKQRKIIWRYVILNKIISAINIDLKNHAPLSFYLFVFKNYKRFLLRS